LQFSARFIPVTEPNLMHKDWRKMAKILDMRTMKRSLNLKEAPAATSVA